MLLIGIDHILALARGTTFEAKMVFNERGAIFAPVSVQHATLKADGISYADNYKGSALAAMLAPGKIEIRFHSAFTDDDVARIIGALAAEPTLAVIASWTVTYQGRPIRVRG